LLHKFSYASLARLVQVLFPLLLYPYLVSTVGLESFGEVLYWVSLSAFLANVAGLNIETYSAKKIKEAVTQKDLFEAIFAPVLLKIMAATLVLFMWFVLLYFNNLDDEGVLLIAFSVYPLLTVVLIPSHVVLGLGRFKELFFATVIEKTILLLLVFLFIKSNIDFYLIPLLYFISISTSVVYFWLMMIPKLLPGFNKFKYKKIELKSYFQVAPILFLGKITQLHTNGGKFILGSFVGVQYIVVYDVCEKIINIFKIPLSIVGQVAFSSIKKTRMAYAKLFSLLSVMSLFFVFVILDFGDYFTSYFLGSKNIKLAAPSLEVLSLIILFMPLLITFGTNYLVKYAKPTTYGKVLFLCNMISITTLFISYFTGNLNYQVFLYWAVFCEVILSIACVLITFKLMRN